jgi:hypothetical protein
MFYPGGEVDNGGSIGAMSAPCHAMPCQVERLSARGHLIPVPRLVAARLSSSVGMGSLIYVHISPNCMPRKLSTASHTYSLLVLRGRGAT